MSFKDDYQIYVAIVLLFLAIGLSIDPLEAQSSSSNNLQTFVGTVHSQTRAASFGVDRGSITFASSASKISWASTGGNMTLLLNVVENSIGVTPTSQKNSSIIDESFTSGAFSMNAILKNTSISYNREIIFTGSTGLIGNTNLLVTLSNPLNEPVTFCNLTCVCYGTMCLDWTGDVATFTQATGVISFTLTPSFTIDPIAVDGSGNCTIGAPASTCNLSLTTSKSPDVIIVGCVVNTNGAGGRHCTPPTATGLTFLFRNSIGITGASSVNMSEWYAIASTALAALTVACNESAVGSGGCTAFGVSGAQTSSPFDTVSGNTGTGANSKPSISTFTTSNAPDFHLVLVGAIGTVAQTASTCSVFTCALITAQVSPVVASQYIPADYVCTSCTMAFGAVTGVGNVWALLADAIIELPAATTTTVAPNYVWLILIPIFLAILLVARPR